MYLQKWGGVKWMMKVDLGLISKEWLDGDLRACGRRNYLSEYMLSDVYSVFEAG